MPSVVFKKSFEHRDSGPSESAGGFRISRHRVNVQPQLRRCFGQGASQVTASEDDEIPI